jgi:biopolymer transport protein ExbB
VWAWCNRALLLLASGAAAASAGAASPDALLERASAARKQAEQALARARTRRLEERKTLAADLQKAYDALAAARSDAKQADRALRELAPEAADATRRAELADYRARRALAQAAEAASVAVEPDSPIAPAEEAIWNGFAGRLAALEGSAAVSVAAGPVVGRDGTERDVVVLRLGEFAAYACGQSRATCGLLGAMPDGRERVVGPYLDAEQTAALQGAARGAVGRLPLDVDGSLRDRAPAEPKTLRTWLAAGGLFVYPILVVGALGLLLVLERLIHLALTQMPAALPGNVLGRLASGDLEGARGAVAKARTPGARILRAGIEAADKPEAQREAAMESALLAEAPRLERSLSLLAALAGVAPLLGLLGTVSGMIATFDTISAAGTGNPRLLSGGISEALITTQLGLMVAIPLLLAHAWLRRWVERREAQLEHCAIQVFGIEEASEEEAT